MAQRRNRSPQDDEQEYGSEPYESGLTLIRVKVSGTLGLDTSALTHFYRFVAKTTSEA